MSHSNCLKDVVDLIGHQAAIRLVRAKGGRDITFPFDAELHDRHWLVVIVGLDNAKKMCKSFWGMSLKLPIEVNALLQLRNESIVEQYNNGISISRIANAYQIDRKHVQNILDMFGLRGKIKAQDSVSQMDLI